MRFLALLILLTNVFYLGCSGHRKDLVLTGDPVHLTSSVNRTLVGVSEEFQFRIKLDYAKDLDPLEIPEMGPEIKGLRILEPVTIEPVRSAGRIYKEKVYRLMGDVSGAFTLPVVEIKFPLKGQEKVLKSSRIFIEVGSEHSSEGMEDILEIDGLVRSKFRRDFLGLYILMGMFFILVLAFYLYQRIGREEVLTIKIPAHEWAFQAIQSLRSRDLLDRGMSIEFCHQLSRILRGYLNRRFSIPAEESTLQELIPRLRTLSVLEPEQTAILDSVLNSMDRIRFTGIGSDSEHLNKSVELISQFINETALYEETNAVVTEGSHGIHG